MKRSGILNRDIAAVVASMGHNDRIIISDAGFPTPDGVPCIDLVVSPNHPGVVEVLDSVLTEQIAEQLVVATQMGELHPELRDEFAARAGEETEFVEVDQQELVALAQGAKAIIRSGEFTTFANCIIVAGVPYS